MFRIDDLLIQAQDALKQFWFVQDLLVVEQTDSTVTIHLTVQPGLFVQVFLSEQSERLSLALVSGRDRIYGWDRRWGEWHLHPYEDAALHEPMAKNVSTRMLLRFLAQVEEILLDNALL